MAWGCEFRGKGAYPSSSSLGSCSGHCYQENSPRHLLLLIEFLPQPSPLWSFKEAIPLLGQNRRAWWSLRSCKLFPIPIKHKAFQELPRSSPTGLPLRNSLLSGWCCPGCIWQQKDYRCHFLCISSRCQLWDARLLCWERWLARYHPCSQWHGSRRSSHISSLSKDSCWSLPEWRWPIVEVLTS